MVKGREANWLWSRDESLQREEITYTDALFMENSCLCGHSPRGTSDGPFHGGMAPVVKASPGW